jgi:hypothetical protein
VGKAHGLRTQEDLAACIGISDRALRDWIKCRTAMEFEKIADCEKLRVDFFDALAAGERKV